MILKKARRKFYLWGNEISRNVSCNWAVYLNDSTLPEERSNCTGSFIIFSVITNIYNKKTKGPTLMELFTATGKLKRFFFFDN